MKSDLRIIAVVSMETEKKYKYTFLHKIRVKREDQKIYAFSEADFPDLNLNDFDDMYLLKVQEMMRHFSTKLLYAFITSILYYIR